MRVSLQNVQKNLSAIANRSQYDPDIVYDILLAYGKPKATISKLKSGSINKAVDDNAVALKNYLYWRVFPSGTNLLLQLDDLKSKNEESKCNARYIIATDLDNLAALDLENSSASGTGTLDTKLRDIDRHGAFFYGLTGNRVVESASESIADRQAAETMNELYAEIERVNLDRLQSDADFLHGLNVFFTRLLFCFFSEDTGIFNDKQFTDAIKDYTNPDGSDLDWFLSRLFESLDTKDEDKGSLSAPFTDFPYVNGTIFDTSRHDIAVPKFNAQARYLLLQCGARDWSNINPDIFGTMFQGIVDPEKRSESGMDYTSVPNIKKVIWPLFLDELKEEFEKYQDNESRLWQLLRRISDIKVFDPACGSGNFLIISFKQLRTLQYKILEQIDSLHPSGIDRDSLKETQLIGISNFYGIEIDDFAHELAVLSLHIAHQQMNMEFSNSFGISFPIIPLIDAPHIVCGNAARIDWQTVCPNRPRVANKPMISGTISLFGDQMPDNSMSVEQVAEYDEIYLVGNPPYKGAKQQTYEQKADLQAIFSDDEKFSKNLDYISIWFIKGARYISGTKAKLAFVSTNSICQGEHVSAMFPKLWEQNVEISFAYTSFRWSNSARDVAGVTVVVLSLSDIDYCGQKYIYSDNVAYAVNNISPYLVDSGNAIVVKRTKPLSAIPEVTYGSYAIDGGALMVDADQLKEIDYTSDVGRFIRKVSGSNELINGVERYCIWIDDANDLKDAMCIPFIKSRVDSCKQFRLSAKSSTSRQSATTPWKFCSARHIEKRCLVIPIVSSENREYIPMGYADASTIVLNSAHCIYDCPTWLFAILESRMHMVWIRTVCGKLETRIRYSNTLGYNTFPVPSLTNILKNKLNQSARGILFARENHSEKTLAELYDPEKMPDDLRQAHIQNDLLVDSLYKTTRFRNDEERLSRLFELYEQITK